VDVLIIKAKEISMLKSIRSQLVLAAVISMASAMSSAQSAEALYKSNCASCHGATGTPSAGMAKMMNIKAASDPDMKKLTADQEFDSVKNGKGKMKPFSGKLTDAQIKDVVAYFRNLK
jgi:mono/diheme cytochrome c family protein